jgi:hypothetical protein
MAKKPKATPQKKAFLKRELVDNAGELHKSLTVILAVLTLVLNAAALVWKELEGVEFISADRWLAVNAVLGALIAGARYVKQPTLHQNA